MPIFAKNTVNSWRQTLMTGFIVAFVHFCRTELSPGEMSPNQADIEVGGSINLTCRISDDDKNSSVLWFSEETTNKEIRQPSEDIIIVDSRTAVLAIRNAIAQQSIYYCKSDDNKAIGLTRVNVGTVPVNIKDFSCRGFNFKDMRCGFTDPINEIYTTYNLSYGTELNANYNCTLQLGESSYRSCNLVNYTPLHNIYVFNLTGENKLGITSQLFRINACESVVLAKANITTRINTNKSVTLSWPAKKIATHCEKEGLEYEIIMQPSGFSYENQSKVTGRCNIEECSVSINLSYCYHNYTFRVRTKVRSDKHDDSMWSEPFSGTFISAPQIPDLPPRTANGSFNINAMETKVRLYWKEIPKYEENGPDFGYLINVADISGRVKNTTKTNQTSIEFPWNDDQVYTYTIKTANALGVSHKSSLINISTILKLSSQYKPNMIRMVYDNKSYILSWEPPINSVGLLSYTVFWCDRKIESPNQCNGTIDFKQLDASQTNFTTDLTEKVLNLAVAANYIDYNTGMHWAMCKANALDDLIRLKPEAKVLSATSIEVHWNPKFVCTALLKGYNLTYCEKTAEVTSAVTKISKKPKCIIVPFIPRDAEKYLIKGLEPFTNYNITMFMYSGANYGPISAELTIATAEAAPSAPRDLQVLPNTITSKSVNISWLPPAETNGHIRYYKIWAINDRNITIEQQLNETQHNRDPMSIIVFKLDNLDSFSNYTVFVTAHTVDDSVQSNKRIIRTLIGIPSAPRELQIENEENHNKVLSWSAPANTSGRVDFYVVQLKIGKDERYVSLIKDTNCNFVLPPCTNSMYTQSLHVLAVNVAKKHEFDYDTYANQTDAMGTERAERTEYELCANTDQQIREHYDDYIQFLGDSIVGDKYLSSPWADATPVFACSEPPPDITNIVILLFVAVGLLGAASFWARKKYNKMKNIEVVLPPYLDNQMEPSDLSRGIDRLVIYKGNYHILPFICNQSIATLPNGDEKIIGKRKEFHTLEDSNEEQSSQSTDSVELNDAESLPSSYTPKKIINIVENEYQKAQTDFSALSAVPAFGGYVTPSSMALAADPNLDENTNMSAFQITPTNGYVTASALMATQQKPQLQVTSNGYVPADSLIKPGTVLTADGGAYSLDASTHSPTETSSLGTTHDFCNEAEIKLQQTAEARTVDEATPALNNSNNNNNNTNNNNSIFGYVTQRQLAYFGQSRN